MPDYFIQIWSWRSATLLISLQSEINVDSQLLRYAFYSVEDEEERKILFDNKTHFTSQP